MSTTNFTTNCLNVPAAIASHHCGFYELGAAQNVALFCYDAGVSGYFRAQVLANGKIRGEYSFAGITLDFTTTGTLPLGEWLFIDMWVQNQGGSHSLMNIVVTGPGSSTILNESSPLSTGFQFAGAVFACNYAAGHFISGVAPDFPNSAGWAWSKLGSIKSGTDNTSVPVAMYAADPSATSYDFLFLCRQTVGVVATLVDSSPNAFNIPSGAGGLTCLLSGPYTP